MYGPFIEPTRTYSVKVAGSVVQLETSFYGGANVRATPRGDITGFSSASRRRLFKFCAAVNWDALPNSYFVTLTYPGEYPTDGLRVKRDLDTFRKAWSREYHDLRAVWKLEFQGRGAPHFHLAITGGEDIEQVKAWTSNAWYRIVGSGDLRHLEAGTQVQSLQGNPAAYFAGYVGLSKGSKEYQHKVPDNYENVGRFWGSWNVAPEWKREQLTSGEFVQLRRLLASSARAAGAPLRSTGRIQSQWHHTRGRSALLVVSQLSRALPRGLYLT